LYEMLSLGLGKSGLIGILVTAIGIILLGFTFINAYAVFTAYFPFQVSGSDITRTLSTLLGAAIQAMFLGVMAWVGSILLLRGVDFLKVEKGVGMVTFKVEKGAGLFTTPEQSEKEKS